MDAIIEAFHEHPELIAVDLSDVLAMDGTGLRVLVEGARHIEDRAAPLRRRLPRRQRGGPAPGAGPTRGARSTSTSRRTTLLGPWLDAAGELPAGV